MALFRHQPNGIHLGFRRRGETFGPSNIPWTRRATQRNPWAVKAERRRADTIARASRKGNR